MVLVGLDGCVPWFLCGVSGPSKTVLYSLGESFVILTPASGGPRANTDGLEIKAASEKDKGKTKA